MLRQDLIQEIRLIVEREPDMLYQTFRLFAEQPGEAVIFFVGQKHACLDPMEQIVIEISRPRLFQLTVKHLVTVFTGMHKAGMQLCGEGKGFPRMTGGQDLLHRALTGKALVHPGGIEIGEALLQEQIHHLSDLFQIDVRRIRRTKRQSHQSKAQFLFRYKIHIRSFLSQCDLIHV